MKCKYIGIIWVFFTRVWKLAVQFNEQNFCNSLGLAPSELKILFTSNDNRSDYRNSCQ